MSRFTLPRVTRGFVTALALGAFVAALGAQQPAPQRGGGPPVPAAPTGPLAPEKYKNIQVLKDAPADQIEATMRFVAAATGFKCTDCHVQEADGTFSYDKDDKRTKGTARDMMKIERGVNEQFFNGRLTVTCYTCHRGANRPVGQPALAEMYTADQLAAMAQQAQVQQGAPAGPGGAPAGGPGAFGRGGPPLPAAADVVSKYVDAVGGQAALAKLQTLVLTGTVTNRAGQTMPFTIEQKMTGKYRETIGQPATMTRGFDGTAGWMQAGGATMDLAGFSVLQATRLADLGLPLAVSTKYDGLRSARGMQVNNAATAAVSGTPAPNTTESLYFDATSGLLVRRTISTRTALGNLPEQIDYSDYRDVGGVKLPFTIKRTSWDALDTFKVVDAKPNAAIDDARFARPR